MHEDDLLGASTRIILGHLENMKGFELNIWRFVSQKIHDQLEVLPVRNKAYHDTEITDKVGHRQCQRSLARAKTAK